MGTPSTIHLVYTGEYDDRSLVAAFVDPEDAEKTKNRLNERRSGQDAAYVEQERLYPAGSGEEIGTQEVWSAMFWIYPDATSSVGEAWKTMHNASEQIDEQVHVTDLRRQSVHASFQVTSFGRDWAKVLGRAQMRVHHMMNAMDEGVDPMTVKG